MRSLNDTLSRLSAFKRSGMSRTMGSRDANRLLILPDFGSNPGALRGYFYLPSSLLPSAAMVVVLHGCTQDAESYDHGSGWSRLADELGFALLYPEQQRGNNGNLCFNWFNANDTQRDAGEALSIRQMVAAMIAEHRIDPARVFVTGLSAGGAMTSVMLATYPEVFAGGAIIAGLPYGTAASVPEAFDRMRAHGGPPAGALSELVTAASRHKGPWPTISVWHGDRDATVSHANSALIVEQWRAIHGIPPEPSAVEHVDGHVRRVWSHAERGDVLEEYRILGLGHGTPLSTSGLDACGVAGPYMLEAGISSTRHIARSWGLTTALSEHHAAPATSKPDPAPHRPSTVSSSTDGGTPDRPQRSSDAASVIENALRAAGLMR